MEAKETKKFLAYKRLSTFIAILFFLGVMMHCTPTQTGAEKKSSEMDDSVTRKKIADLFDRSDQWMAPDTTQLSANATGRQILYGRDLIANTALYLGPNGFVSHSSNGMNCQNCHLDAGTRLYANSFSAVASTYPKLRPRSGALESVEKRVNDCMERSMNGKKLDSLSKEMRAMVAYIKWVGKDVKKDIIPRGSSVVDLPFLDRAADSATGRIAYMKNCITCHGTDGQGKLNVDEKTYQYPPLWGSHSYNVSAGLFRLSRLAGYIKSNMPYLTSSHDKPILTNEEAWDIAAFVNSKPRPAKKFKEDYPDISKKPFDHPYGPYSDNYSETQHKYGPFAAMPSAKKKK